MIQTASWQSWPHELVGTIWACQVHVLYLANLDDVVKANRAPRPALRALQSQALFMLPMPYAVRYACQHLHLKLLDPDASAQLRCILRPSNFATLATCGMHATQE